MVNVIRLLRLLRFSWLVFLAVLTCAGQFEDASVVLWVDRVVCGGFSLDCMLLLLEKLFQVEESCFRLLQLVKDCFISFRAVVWCCLMFSFVSSCVTLLGFFRLVFGWLLFVLVALLCLCCVKCSRLFEMVLVSFLLSNLFKFVSG